MHGFKIKKPIINVILYTPVHSNLIVVLWYRNTSGGVAVASLLAWTEAHVVHGSAWTLKRKICDEQLVTSWWLVGDCRYNLMLKCWLYVPHARPSFKYLVQQLNIFARRSTDPVDVFSGQRRPTTAAAGMRCCVLNNRGVATGVYRYIYPQNQSTLQIFTWLLVVFFLFDPGQIVVDFEIGMTS